MQPDASGRRRRRRYRLAAEPFGEVPQVAQVARAAINEIEYKQRESEYPAGPIEEINENAFDLPDSVHSRFSCVSG
jgi:hypothetical protein